MTNYVNLKLICSDRMVVLLVFATSVRVTSQLPTLDRTAKQKTECGFGGAPVGDGALAVRNVRIARSGQQ